MEKIRRRDGRRYPGFRFLHQKTERITHDVRQDIIPMWSPDGEDIYYISDPGRHHESLRLSYKDKRDSPIDFL